ncbi:hypothetical protein [Novosphingobium sp. 9]|uniref:hypothetical protein n=1 Tax=Novosphingobium sp. 9 TaxID=2025349 RepID=UPI0021B640CC|nr:hypothetical protein [Novosphingobium sp. 9]
MNAPIAQQALADSQLADSALLVAPSLTQRRLQCYLALLLADIFAILVGFSIVGYVFMGQRGLKNRCCSHRCCFLST